jgi:hypothetical protein
LQWLAAMPQNEEETKHEDSKIRKLENVVRSNQNTIAVRVQQPSTM